MKGFRLAALLSIAAAGASPAWAQTPSGRLVRGDVSGTLGWFNINKTEIPAYSDWTHRTLFGGAGMGWYWTSHLKTEVEVGATRKIEIYSYRPVTDGGRTTIAPAIYQCGTRRLRFSQSYQFRDNQWFHPFVGGGLVIVRERIERRDEPAYTYDSVTRQSVLLRPARQYPVRTETRTFAAVSGGFKAYMTPRGFFLTDLRTTFDSRAEEVVLQVGFGVDF